MERCWHGKFTGAEQCLSEGRYGNRTTEAAPIGRTRRPFCFAAALVRSHKHPGISCSGPVTAARRPEQDATSATSGTPPGDGTLLAREVRWGAPMHR